MNRLKTKLFQTTTLALLFTACHDIADDISLPNATDATPIELSGSIDQQNITRANDYGFVTGSVKCRQVSASEYRAIVVPQNITTRRPLVEVISQGVSYLMEGKISLKPGYRHTIIVTLDKNPEQTKIDIGGEIGGW